jgi:AraC-like DNA-binding protein
VRVRLDRHGDPRAGFVLATAPVPPALAPYLSSWCGYDEWAKATVCRVELPQPRGTVVIELGAPLAVGRVGGAPETFADGGFCAGLDDQPSLTSFSRRQRGLQLTLTPRGTAALSRCAGAALFTRVASLAEVGLVEGAARLQAADAKAHSDDACHWGALFALLAEVVCRALRRGHDLSPAVCAAVAALDASAGALRIDALASQLGMSRSQLHRRFVAELGASPKTYAGLARFARVRALVCAPEVRLADVAAAAGYADQAHLAREVRHLAHVTPRALQQQLTAPLSVAVSQASAAR